MRLRRHPNQDDGSFVRAQSFRDQSLQAALNHHAARRLHLPDLSPPLLKDETSKNQTSEH